MKEIYILSEMKNKNPARKTKGSTHQKNHPILTLPTLLPGGVPFHEGIVEKITSNKHYFLLEFPLGIPAQTGYYIGPLASFGNIARADLQEKTGVVTGQEKLGGLNRNTG